MKKNSIILISILLLVCLMFTAGCAFDLSTVKYIQITNAPKTTYVQTVDDSGIDAEKAKFAITVTFNDDTQKTINYASSYFTIENFSTKEVGAFKAIITYQGVSAVFDYEVVSDTATKFAGGTGISEDPYLISNAKHWNDIDAELTTTPEKCYFKLTNDIDLKDVVINPIGYKNVKGGGYIYKKISLDGANFSLRNINKVNHTNSGKYSALMGLDNGSVIKDTNFYFTSSGANGALGITYVTNGTVTFNNVNTYGYINTVGNSASNVGVFSVDPNYEDTVNKTTTINFTGCNNYTNVLGGTATYIGGFIGQSTNTQINFTNCINYGNMKGAITAAGGFIGNANYGKETAVVKNCANKGVITQLQPNIKDESGKITKWYAGQFAGTLNGYVVSNGVIASVMPTGENYKFTETAGSIDTITEMKLTATTPATTPVTTPIAFAATTTSFTFTNITNATKYVVQYTFDTKKTDDSSGTERFQINYNTNIDATYYNTIKAYTTAPQTTTGTPTSDDKYFVNGNIAYLYLDSIKATTVEDPKVYVFAYDANGTLIGFGNLGAWVATVNVNPAN